jgi:hypothetical protein|tara:strand:+ start:91 stop:528 length:438 start_codon:yes stop_codon:yes gene_type:complete
VLNIDWANFTLLNSLMGGILIGIAATIIFFVNGRIMGISGILGNLIATKETDQKFWRIIFILGVLIGPLIFILLFKEIKSEMVANTTLLIISGFLVGLGTSLGNGCTSGHGICGLSRFSIRSIVATLVFVISGMITVYLINGNLL